MRALAAEGVFVTPPGGWDIRIRRRPPPAGETTHTVVHAATFPLPSERGDYGDGAVQRMGPTDVFIALVEFHPASAGTPLFAARGFPPPLAPDDLSRASLQRSITGHAGAQRWFTTRGRPWCLYVVIGSWADRARLVPLANQLVAGIEVSSL